ncbi:hypothetical protein K488DRAFT_50950 [Vararia minispora EC-137]|uniref:Uncharacterized protein n=1 Tax=Vararia minispora EC-137 TaxID=1314806 RepID=A0ACB8QJR8_9AGAM|nr:hypothetical protein K488DRAFT_50950 [Vararia minispora EC-137]
MPGPSGRTLTARQAVLASAAGSSHVSLDDVQPSRKKKQLNEAELALRREETARKRKHMSEKKLEDEKAETINRLLKKQSRPRNKRNALATADDRTPATQTNAAGTPDGDEEGEAVPAPIEIPTMYRWISTSRSVLSTSVGGDNQAPPGGGDAQVPLTERAMILSFSVPLNALPENISNDVPSSAGAAMDVDAPVPPSRKMTPYCVAPGCDRASKYRLKNNFLQGVCGIEHLRLLEQAPKVR